MKFKSLFGILIFLVCIGLVDAKSKKKKPNQRKVTEDKFQNQLIDYKEFQRIVDTSAETRESHRLTEDKFLLMMKESGVIVLDARSESRYNLRHITGALNLPFTEFTETNLAKVIPSKKSKILIYCNNNFDGSPAAFAAKAPAASLNLSTYNSLRAYGYSEIFELGPLLDVEKTKIPFEGSEVSDSNIKQKENEKVDESQDK
ncbi:MAG: rhodanese-like domain-containing protein [Leptospira sp.]|nr:rhodanese-like domain-containing protein [Leptospira sp.]